MALTLSPVQDRGVAGVSSIARRITERKLAEAAIRQTHEQLERHAHQLRLLAELGDMLQASSIPEDAYAVAARFAQTLDSASSAPCLCTPHRETAQRLPFDGEKSTRMNRTFLDECWALRTGTWHEVPHWFALPPSATPTSMLLCAPMIAHGETLGMLHLRWAPAESSPLRWRAPGVTGFNMARRDHGGAPSRLWRI